MKLFMAPCAGHGGAFCWTSRRKSVRKHPPRQMFILQMDFYFPISSSSWDGTLNPMELLLVNPFIPSIKRLSVFSKRFTGMLLGASDRGRNMNKCETVKNMCKICFSSIPVLFQFHSFVIPNLFQFHFCSIPVALQLQFCCCSVLFEFQSRSNSVSFQIQ